MSGGENIVQFSFKLQSKTHIYTHTQKKKSLAYVCMFSSVLIVIWMLLKTGMSPLACATNSY